MPSRWRRPRFSGPSRWTITWTPSARCWTNTAIRSPDSNTGCGGWRRAGLADEPPVFAHGDYRMGNIMVDGRGLVGILDWEVGHRGDRYVDLSWPSVRAWRFGRDATPLAGVGQREDFYRAYEEAGGAPVDRAAVHYWEVLGTLRWGIMCMTIGQQFTSGRERSVEKAVIGRRVAETELDFLSMLDPL
ncbi:MAG: phosphotransferase [Minwuia sp.]|uniref:phosphotransferase n=1 Tax=Minwuia sp. TaxID=2493630 RepID=UPI003A85E9B9